MPTDGAPSYTTSVHILYLGLPLGAVVLLRAGLAPVGCMIGHPDAIGMRRLRRSLPRETLILGRPSLDDTAVNLPFLDPMQLLGVTVPVKPKARPLQSFRDVGRGLF